MLADRLESRAQSQLAATHAALHQAPGAFRLHLRTRGAACQLGQRMRRARSAFTAMPAAGAWAAVRELHFRSAMDKKMQSTSSLDGDDDVDVAASGVAVSAIERERAAAAAHDNRS